MKEKRERTSKQYKEWKRRCHFKSYKHCKDDAKVFEQVYINTFENLDGIKKNSKENQTH